MGNWAKIALLGTLSLTSLQGAGRAQGSNAEAGHEVRPATQTAWSALMHDDPAAASAVGPATRSLLTRVSVATYLLLQEGASPGDLFLLDGRNLGDFLRQTLGLGGGFVVPFFSIDAGGARSSGGVFAIDGTIGQPDAGSMISGDQLTILLGGYREQLGNLIFEDGFESGTTGEWSGVVP